MTLKEKLLKAHILLTQTPNKRQSIQPQQVKSGRSILPLIILLVCITTLIAMFPWSLLIIIPFIILSRI